MQHKKPVQGFWPSVQRLSLNIATPTQFACQSFGLIATFVTATVVAMPIGQQQATAALLTNWQFDPGTNQLEVMLPDGITPKFSLLNEPTRIVVDLPNTEVATDTTQLYREGTVRSVSLSQFQPAIARIVIDFAPGVVLTPEQVQLQRIGLENRWVLRPLVSGTETPLSQGNQATGAMGSPTAQPRGDRPPTAVPQTTAQSSRRVQTPSAPQANRFQNPPTANPPVLETPNAQIQPLNVPIVSVPVNQTRREAVLPSSSYAPPRSR
ncbi:MAG TPA: AMIN domain-containing protein, partial [Kamptonema sp.]|nr:AMIN domain-containing protein [Kamptonema sp.]